MKVGIITFHFPYNCGAVLQCLALQTKLEELGHEVCIINYRPWYHQNRYTPLKNPFFFSSKCFHDSTESLTRRYIYAVDGFLRTVYSWRHYPMAVKKEQYFRTFVSKNLHETRVYRSLKQLQKIPPKCDVYISGSDQLWNSGLTGGKLDSAYFLNFGDTSVGRMTYSVGTNFTNLEKPEEVLQNLVKSLDIISLRETKWLAEVEKATKGKQEIHVDVDPTLLLDAKHYTQFMPNMPNEPESYILTYTMIGTTQKQVYNGARILSERLGIKIIDICGDPNIMNQKVKDNRLCGPGEFLKYVQNAEYVITNSFHGTVFSVIFQKKFITIPHAQTGNRVTELLDKLGLFGRYHYVTMDAVEEVTNEIDYSAVSEKLDALREESISFLRDSVTKLGYAGGKVL